MKSNEKNQHYVEQEVKDPAILSLEQSLNLNSVLKLKHKRRSKNDNEGRSYKCNLCGKTYLSYPALYTHNKTKHKEIKTTLKYDKDKNINSARGRGKPKEQMGKSELLIMDFFGVKEKDSETIENILLKVLSDIDPDNSRFNLNLDEKDLKSIFCTKKIIKVRIVTKQKNSKVENNHSNAFTSINEIVTNYLIEVYKYAEEEKLSNTIKIILLFRESMNRHGWMLKFALLKDEDCSIVGNKIYITKAQEEQLTLEFCQNNNGEIIPDLVNYFLVQDEEKWKDFIENREWMMILLENFCEWLFLKGYTCGKLKKIVNLDEK